MELKISDMVTWTSQAQGVSKTKTGKVVAIIEPGQDATQFLPAGLPKSRFKGERFSQNRRALVAVPRGKGYDYYATPVGWLKVLEKVEE